MLCTAHDCTLLSHVGRGCPAIVSVSLAHNMLRLRLPLPIPARTTAVRREPFTSKALYVTGYGRLDEAPAAGAPFTTALPGMRILLQAGGG